MTKLKLDAFLFSMEEFPAIYNWSQKNQSIFDVKMPAGIACGALTRVIYLPDIQSTDAAGILIADHQHFRKEQIITVVRQLKLRDKLLYSVTNGLEPLGKGQKSEAPKYDCFFASSPILKILDDCRPAIRWLHEKGPTQNLPVRFAVPVKRLENLGLVFRRNNKTFSLRHHRLKKVLAHESEKLTKACRIEDLLSA